MLNTVISMSHYFIIDWHEWPFFLNWVAWVILTQLTGMSHHYTCMRMPKWKTDAHTSIHTMKAWALCEQLSWLTSVVKSQTPGKNILLCPLPLHTGSGLTRQHMRNCQQCFALGHWLTVLLPNLKLEDGIEMALLAAASASNRCKTSWQPNTCQESAESIGA